MAPTPKPPGARVRRNKDQPSWTTVGGGTTAEKPKVPSPASGMKWGKVARDYWKAIWSSPVASTYLPTDVVPLSRLCTLVDERDRFERGGYTIATLEGDEVHVHQFGSDAEIRLLEDRFGLSPTGRRRLMVQVDGGEVPGQAAESEPKDDERFERLRSVK